MDVTISQAAVAYGAEHALRQASFTIPSGTISALLGPNGAGKTTAARAIAGWLPLDAGDIAIGGASTVDERRALSCYTDNASFFLPERKIQDSLDLAVALRQSFDLDSFLADLGEIDVFVKKRPRNLSTGQRAGLALAAGIASRTPVTIFDETFHGLDANKRQYFFRRLLEDYGENPRTIIVCTHQIVDIEPLVEHVVVMRRGECVWGGSVDSLTSGILTIIGAKHNIAELVGGEKVLSTNNIGDLLQVSVATDTPDALRARAASSAVQVTSPSLEDAVVALTGAEAPATVSLSHHDA